MAIIPPLQNTPFSRSESRAPRLISSTRSSLELSVHGRFLNRVTSHSSGNTLEANTRLSG
eukprot:4345394-Prymnesium_polylepis.1